jgi:hypothetical protein
MEKNHTERIKEEKRQNKKTERQRKIEPKTRGEGKPKAEERTLVFFQNPSNERPTT